MKYNRNDRHAKTYKIIIEYSITRFCHVLYRGKQQIALPYPFINVAVLQQIEYEPGTYGMSNEM